MRPSILKRERLAKQTRERGLFLHINTPQEEPLPQNLQQMIDERIARGDITRCPAGVTALPKPKARHRRASVPIVRLSGKII